jgi:hypothetical protein
LSMIEKLGPYPRPEESGVRGPKLVIGHDCFTPRFYSKELTPKP